MKLLYNDPIIAAYMVQHHSIILVDNFGEPITSIPVLFRKMDGIIGVGMNARILAKAYVAGYQHHLFKPMVGDVIDIGSDDRMPIVNTQNDVMCAGHIPLDSIDKYKIIMRDGKHFFMPEVEE